LLASAATAEPPNVLFIIVDDLNCDIACYGKPEVNTPAIDALAQAGVRFAAAYAQAPTCNASRASLLSGRYPTATLVFDNETDYRDALPDAVTLPRRLREHGYATARAGKIEHRGFEDHEAWALGAEPPRAKPRRRARRRDPSANDYWRMSDGGKGEAQPDYRAADTAISLLHQLRDERFFLAVGFGSPHPAFIAPRSFFEAHPYRDIRLPADFAEEPPQAAIWFRPNRGIFVGRKAWPIEAQRMISGYRAATSFADAQVGRVIAALETLGLRDETVVVFLSDHGFHLGEKGLWSKDTLFEHATRVPLIFSWPGELPQGRVSHRTVELVDLYPTLLELTDAPASTPLDGQSFEPLLRAPEKAWPHPARSWLRRGSTFGATVRTDRHRYTEWSGAVHGRELYDHAEDGAESHNLAESAEHETIMDSLRALMLDPT
jgi:uncharacterized sulfatase